MISIDALSLLNYKESLISVWAPLHYRQWKICLTQLYKIESLALLIPSLNGHFETDKSKNSTTLE
jgi:hypothetical protein